jgi:hypothetical protein
MDMRLSHGPLDLALISVQGQHASEPRDKLRNGLVLGQRVGQRYPRRLQVCTLTLVSELKRHERLVQEAFGGPQLEDAPREVADGALARSLSRSGDPRLLLLVRRRTGTP